MAAPVYPSTREPVAPSDFRYGAELSRAKAELRRIFAGSPELHAYAWQARRHNPRESLETFIRDAYARQPQIYRRPELVDVDQVVPARQDERFARSLSHLARGAGQKGLKTSQDIRRALEAATKQSPHLKLAYGFEENSFAYAFFVALIDESRNEALFVGVGYSE